MDIAASARRRISVALDLQIHRMLRLRALNEGTTVQALVEGWIEAALAHAESSPAGQGEQADQALEGGPDQIGLFDVDCGDAPAIQEGEGLDGLFDADAEDQGYVESRLDEVIDAMLSSERRL